MDDVKLIDEELKKVAYIMQAENADLAMVKKGKEDFANFVTHTLRHSMLTGIPQIAQARNCSKRMIRSLVFCFCIAGFIYQSYTFMSIYWEYDVVMDVQVTSPFFIEPPAITVCSLRGVMYDEMCRDNSTREYFKTKFTVVCESLLELMDYIDGLTCECNPRLCDTQGNPYDWWWITPPRRCDAIPYEEISPWLIPEKSVAGHCKWENLQTRGGELENDCTKPELMKRVPCNNQGAREACVTYFSKYGEPNWTMPEISIGTRIQLILFMHDKYIGEDSGTNEVYVTIHDPRTVGNPFKEGFLVEPGRMYNVQVKKVEKELLPKPYKTDCMDYYSIWKSRGGQGPLNLKECLTECQVNMSLKIYGCVIPGIPFVGFGPRCEAREEDARLLEVYTLANEFSMDVCKPACEETYYTTTVTSKPFNHVSCWSGEYKHAQMDVYFDGMEITRYSYTPKYQDIETFSYVGGYVGMWLGISLVAVFDFLETIFMMLKYPLRRLKTFRNKRKIQNQIIGHLHH